MTDSVLHTVDLGLLDYRRALEAQAALVRSKCLGAGPDYLLLLEHPPVYTLGRGGDARHLLSVGDTPVYRVSRGGGATFHGPGQLVGYPVVDLTRHGRDVHVYLRRLEAALVDALAAFGLVAAAVPGLTGVWANGLKIASIGVGVRRWITYHGFALNVDVDLGRFDRIVPCGLAGVRMTSMGALLSEPPARAQVKEVVARAFGLHFGYRRVLWRHAEAQAPPPQGGGGAAVQPLSSDGAPAAFSWTTDSLFSGRPPRP